MSLPKVTIRPDELEALLRELRGIAEQPGRAPGAQLALKQVRRAVMKTSTTAEEFAIQPSETSEWALRAARNAIRP
jgi:hypothetical protein